MSCENKSTPFLSYFLLIAVLLPLPWLQAADAQGGGGSGVAKGLNEADKIIAKARDKVETDMQQDMSWLANYKDNDDGAFGKEFELRMAAELEKEKGIDVRSIYVNNETKKVVSISEAPPDGVEGTTQVDLAEMRNKTLKLKVGDVFTEKVECVADFKAGRVPISEDQATRLSALCDGGDFKVIRPKSIYTRAKGWFKNPKFSSILKILVLADLAKTAYNCVNYYQYEQEFDEVATATDRLRNSKGEYEKRLNAGDAQEKINQYIQHFIPGFTSNFSTIVTMYATETDD